jgi:hypothetical protein
MGLSCATLRDATFSNPRRGTDVQTQASTLDQRSSQSSESRQEILRALSFEEGFKLGIKVRKLESILLKIDADEPAGPRAPPETLDNLLKEGKWCRISKG